MLSCNSRPVESRGHKLSLRYTVSARGPRQAMSHGRVERIGLWIFSKKMRMCSACRGLICPGACLANDYPQQWGSSSKANTGSLWI